MLSQLTQKKNRNPFYKPAVPTSLYKHRHAVRAERMTLLTREFCLRSERVVDGVDGL